MRHTGHCPRPTPRRVGGSDARSRRRHGLRSDTDLASLRPGVLGEESTLSTGKLPPPDRPAGRDGTRSRSKSSASITPGAAERPAEPLQVAAWRFLFLAGIELIGQPARSMASTSITPFAKRVGRVQGWRSGGSTSADCAGPARRRSTSPAGARACRAVSPQRDTLLTVGAPIRLARHGSPVPSTGATAADVRSREGLLRRR